LRLTRATPPPEFGYRTRVITDGVQPSLHVEYKHSHVKQYFKEQHALRTETTINNPKDFYVAKRVDNLTYLRDRGQQVNRTVLEVERLSHHCVLTQHGLDRLQQPTIEAGSASPRCALATHASWPCSRCSPGSPICRAGSAIATYAPASQPYSAAPIQPPR